MTKRRLTPRGGIGGWFDPTPAEWAALESAYGRALSPEIRKKLASIVANYTEGAEREEASFGTDEVQRTLGRARDRADALHRDLAAFDEDHPLADALDNALSPSALREIRSIVFQFVVAADAVAPNLSVEGDRKPGEAWTAMIGALIAAFEKAALPATISYQEVSNRASPFVMLVIEINGLLRPRYRQTLHRTQLATWAQNLKVARRNWKKSRAAS